MKPDWSHLLEYIRSTPVSEEDIEHFRTKWTRKYVEDTGFKPVVSFSRIPKSAGEDTFFVKTVKSSSTIPNSLTLIRRNLVASAEEESERDEPDTITLLDLGSDLNGFKNTTHAGVLCSIMDEALSICVEIHRQRSTAGRASIYTALLTTNYRVPVISPITVAVKSRLERRQGRKWYVRGHIEDEAGRVLVETEGLWVSMKEKS